MLIGEHRRLRLPSESDHRSDQVATHFMVWQLFRIFRYVDALPYRVVPFLVWLLLGSTVKMRFDGFIHDITTQRINECLVFFPSSGCRMQGLYEGNATTTRSDALSRD